jgi:drug/metabolite transporter (DMT)-like permease
MTISAACQFVGNIFIIMALRTGEIAVVAPFRYGAIPLSIFLGWLWWGDIPNTTASAGIGLVMAAGLYTLHRERHGLRLARAAPATERSVTP